MSSEVKVNVSPRHIVTLCNITVVWLHQISFCLSLAVLGSTGDKSDSQISEIVALNPSLTLFSSKINVRDLF